MRVVEISTGETIYTNRFRGRANCLGFFADSKTLFFVAMAFLGQGKYGNQEAWVDLRTGKYTERLTEEHDEEVPLGDGVLLIGHRERKSQTATLILVQLPDYRKLSGVPYSTQPREANPTVGRFENSSETGLFVSANRQIVTYSFDHTVMCRRASDLGILWTRPIKFGLRSLKLAVSATGNRIGAAVAGEWIQGRRRESYIWLYDVATGADVGQLSLDGTEGMALSPDGKLIAVVEHRNGRKNEDIVTIHIYVASNGQRVASFDHDTIRAGHGQRARAAASVEFTSDGRYLVSSGMTTKVWKLEGMLGL